MSIISNDINKAVAILNSEDIVAIPTETVYGLAGNIYSEKAIRKIFEVKKRPLFNPLIVHLYSVKQLNEIVTNIPEKAQKLAEAFWPGSLTLVLKKNEAIPDLITAGKDTVAVRIPNHPVTLQLLKALDFPLAAPSANPFNRISPTQALHVEQYFKNSIQMVLEGGSCTSGIESTIIGFEGEEAVLYRLGAISLEDIETVIGNIIVKNKSELAPAAPGMLAKHYSPTTKTFLVDDVLHFIENNHFKNIGVLQFKDSLENEFIAHLEVLSKSGNLNEAASNLYHAMHTLDALNLDAIVIQKMPNYGLGKSMNDRLERAAN